MYSTSLLLICPCEPNILAYFNAALPPLYMFCEHESFWSYRLTWLTVYCILKGTCHVIAVNFNLCEKWQMRSGVGPRCHPLDFHICCLLLEPRFRGGKWTFACDAELKVKSWRKKKQTAVFILRNCDPVTLDNPEIKTKTVWRDTVFLAGMGLQK